MLTLDYLTFFVGYGEFLETQSKPFVLDMNGSYEEYVLYAKTNYHAWLSYVAGQLEHFGNPSLLLLTWPVFEEGTDALEYLKYGFKYEGSLCPPLKDLQKEHAERVAGRAKWANIGDKGLRHWLMSLAKFTSLAYGPRKDSKIMERSAFLQHCLNLVERREAVVEFFDVSEDVNIERLNAASLDELKDWFDGLTNVDPEYSFAEVSKSQSVGRSDVNIQWTFDRIVREAGRMALGPVGYLDACYSAKLQATRMSRLRAHVRTASAIATKKMTNIFQVG